MLPTYCALIAVLPSTAVLPSSTVQPSSTVLPSSTVRLRGMRLRALCTNPLLPRSPRHWRFAVRSIKRGRCGRGARVRARGRVILLDVVTVA